MELGTGVMPGDMGRVRVTKERHLLCRCKKIVKVVNLCRKSRKVRADSMEGERVGRRNRATPGKASIDTDMSWPS